MSSDVLAALEFDTDPRPELEEFFGAELVGQAIATLQALVSDRWGAPGAPVSGAQVLAYWRELDDTDRRVVRGRAHAEHRVGSQAWPLLVGTWLAKVAHDYGHDLHHLNDDQRAIAGCDIWDSTDDPTREHLIDLWNAAGEQARGDRDQ